MFFGLNFNEAALSTIANMLNAQHGLGLTPDDIIKLGKDIRGNERNSTSELHPSRRAAV